MIPPSLGSGMTRPAILPATFSGWDKGGVSSAPGTLPAEFDGWDAPKPAAATASGPTGLFGKLWALYRGAANAVAPFQQMIGAVKEAGSQLRRVGTEAPRPTGALPAPLPAREAASFAKFDPEGVAAKEVPSKSVVARALNGVDLQPRGIPQKLGAGELQAAEYFVPGPDALKFGETGERVADAVHGGELAGRIGRMVGDAATNSLHDAGVAATQGTNVKGATIGGAVAPVALEGALGAAKRVRPIAWLFEHERRLPLTALAAEEIVPPEVVARVAHEEGIPLAAGEVFDPSSVDAGRLAAARGQPGLGGRVRAHVQQALESWRGAAGRFLDRMASPTDIGAAQDLLNDGVSPTEEGAALQKAAQRQADAATASINAHGDRLRTLVKGNVVDLTPVRNLGVEMQDATAGARRLVPSLDPKTASKLGDELSTMDDLARGAHTDVGTAMLLRSRLWKLGHIPSDVLPEEAQVVARRAIAPLTQAIEDALRPSGDEALQEWRALNREWAQYASTYGTRGQIAHTLLNAASDADLEKLPAKVLDGSLAKLKQLRDAGIDIAPAKRVFLRQALGGGRHADLAALADELALRPAPWLQDAFSEPQEYGWLQRLERRGTVEGIASPNGYENMDRLNSRLRRAASAGQLDELFGADDADRLRALTTIGSRIGRRFNPSGTEVLREAAEAADPAKWLPGTLRRAYLGKALDPEVTARLVRAPTLGAGPEGGLASAVKRALRAGAGSTGGAIGAESGAHQ